MRFGCTMSLVPRFTPAAVLAAIQRDRATIFEGVPTMFADLLSCPDLDSYDLSSLRVAISGGASIPAPVLDAFEERLGLVILEGYGMTETASTTTFNPSADERRAYSVGKPIWGTQTQVWDADGRPLPPGPEHVGEIVTRGLHVMKGYLHNPEATASAFTGDWLHTGDLGYFDEDGFLFIVSRKKELIIRGGYNVYPSEIENVLHAHPAVAEAAVVGIPDERLGEEVMAVVIVRPAMDLLEHELVSYCRERLAAYKCPRVFQFRSELPKNTLGKVLKDELVPAEQCRRSAMPQTTMNRMSTLDAEFFFAEHDNVPMHIGSVAVFDGPAPALRGRHAPVRGEAAPGAPVPPGGPDRCPCRSSARCGPTMSSSRSGTTSGTPRFRRPEALSSSAPSRRSSSPGGWTGTGRCGRSGSSTGWRAAAGPSCPRSTTAWWTAIGGNDLMTLVFDTDPDERRRSRGQLGPGAAALARRAGGRRPARRHYRAAAPAGRGTGPAPAGQARGTCWTTAAVWARARGGWPNRRRASSTVPSARAAAGPGPRRAWPS